MGSKMAVPQRREYGDLRWQCCSMGSDIMAVLQRRAYGDLDGSAAEKGVRDLRWQH